MELNPGFIRAVEEEQFRQKFLHDIANNRLPKYVSNLVYNPIQIGDGEKETLMRTCPSLLVRFYIKGTKSDIEVFPASFALDSSHTHQRLDDFLSTLEDHEYYHAREFYENPQTIAHPIYRRVELLRRALFCSDFDDYAQSVKVHDRNVELRAISNQMEGFSERDCSKEHKLYWAIKKAELDPDNKPVIIDF